MLHFAVAKTKYKQQFDKKTKLPTFKVGHRVWLYCRHTPVGLSPKLCKKWLGPYYICDAYDNFTYKLRHCVTNKLVKSVAHANRLKVYFSPQDRPVSEPKLADVQDDLNPEEIPNSEQSQTDKSAESTSATSATKVKGKDDKSPTQAPLPTIVGKPSQVIPPKSPSPTTNTACNDVPSLGTDKNKEEGSNGMQTNENKSDWYIVDKIVKSAMIGKKLHFQIKWKNYKNCTWEPRENVPEELIREYYIKKKRRKVNSKCLITHL